MMTEGLDSNLTIEKQREQAFVHFKNQNFHQLVINSWLQTSRLALAEAGIFLPQLSRHREDGKSHEILQTLSGSVFEYLVLADLQSKNNQNTYISISPYFNIVLEAIVGTGKIETSYRQDGYYFGTSIKWDEHVVIIPDGLIIKHLPEQAIIAGIFESSLSHRPRNIDRVWLFIEFLRENPQALKGIGYVIFPGQHVDLLDDDEFTFMSVRPFNRKEKQLDQERKGGWDVKKSVFEGWYAGYLTRLILKDYLKTHVIL